MIMNILMILEKNDYYVIGIFTSKKNADQRVDYLKNCHHNFCTFNVVNICMATWNGEEDPDFNHTQSKYIKSEILIYDGFFP